MIFAAHTRAADSYNVHNNFQFTENSFSHSTSDKDFQMLLFATSQFIANYALSRISTIENVTRLLGYSYRKS